MTEPHGGGRRAHELVRAGEEVDIPAREVTIHAFELGEIRRAGEFVDVMDEHLRAGGPAVVDAGHWVAQEQPEALVAALRPRLPAYMLPSRVVIRSELPRSPNGKFDRPLIVREVSA